VVVAAATRTLTEIGFAVSGLDEGEQRQAYRLLRSMRAAAGDFPEGK
jgi:hypothetical protein